MRLRAALGFHVIAQIFGRIDRLLYGEHDAVLHWQKVEQPIDLKAHRLDLASNFLEAHFVKGRRGGDVALLGVR